MYILYGGRLTRTIGPQMVLQEGDLAYELREIDILADEHRTPEFRAINPAGYVPALITPEGETLHEAAAIMLYLADRHGLDDLAPAPDAPERGLFYSKLFFLTNDVQPALKRYFFPHRYSTDDADTPRIKARALDTAMERWAVVDDHLAAHGPYHLGARFSLVDLYMAMWAVFGFAPTAAMSPNFPALRRCYDLVAARPKIAALLAATESMVADDADAKSERGRRA